MMEHVGSAEVSVRGMFKRETIKVHLASINFDVLSAPITYPINTKFDAVHKNKGKSLPFEVPSLLRCTSRSRFFSPLIPCPVYVGNLSQLLLLLRNRTATKTKQNIIIMFSSAPFKHFSDRSSLREGYHGVYRVLLSLLLYPQS